MALDATVLKTAIVANITALAGSDPAYAAVVSDDRVILAIAEAIVDHIVGNLQVTTTIASGSSSGVYLASGTAGAIA